MNRKRKMNELYKGVFKNDKKSCLVDLKPLDRKRELEAIKEEEKSKVPKEEFKQEQRNTKVKTMNVNLKVNKNLGFGAFFENLREEVVQIFTAKEDYISFEGLVSSDQVNELFNGSFSLRESTNKSTIDLEKVSLDPDRNFIPGKEKEKNDLNLVKRELEEIESEDEEIIYEDEVETIYKRRKPQSRKFVNVYDDNFEPSKRKLNFQKDSNIFDISNMINLNNCNLNSTMSRGRDPKLTKINDNNFFPFKKSTNHSLFEEVKTRKNRRSQFSEIENSENVNTLNQMDLENKRFMSKF